MNISSFTLILSTLNRPEGFVKLEREDGSWREGFCLDGVWEGLVREFDSDRNLKVSN